MAKRRGRRKAPRGPKNKQHFADKQQARADRRAEKQARRKERRQYRTKSGTTKQGTTTLVENRKHMSTSTPFGTDLDKRYRDVDLNNIEPAIAHTLPEFEAASIRGYALLTLASDEEDAVLLADQLLLQEGHITSGPYVVAKQRSMYNAADFATGLARMVSMPWTMEIKPPYVSINEHNQMKALAKVLLTEPWAMVVIPMYNNSSIPVGTKPFFVVGTTALEIDRVDWVVVAQEQERPEADPVQHPANIEAAEKAVEALNENQPEAPTAVDAAVHPDNLKAEAGDEAAATGQKPSAAQKTSKKPAAKTAKAAAEKGGQKRPDLGVI